MIEELDDRWVCLFEDATVERCSFDWSASWLIVSSEGTFQLRVEQPFTLECGDVTYRLDPEGNPVEMAAVLRTLREGVTRIDAMKSGALRVSFQSGIVLDVESATQFEAWEIAGPDGVLLVSLPGGGVATWKGNQVGGLH